MSLDGKDSQNTRTRLRDYAREPVELERGLYQRGEIGAKAFVALQRVLDYLEASDFYGDEITPRGIRHEIAEALR